tara:strand:- start:1940 stop:2197 length:258 start_codon:yes stop_codon:yes gene_type:complete
MKQNVFFKLAIESGLAVEIEPDKFKINQHEELLKFANLVQQLEIEEIRTLVKNRTLIDGNKSELRGYALARDGIVADIDKFRGQA